MSSRRSAGLHKGHVILRFKQQRAMGHRGGGFVLMGAVLAAGLAAPRAALGTESAEESERAIRRGIELRKSHDNEGAVREFQRAYDEAPTPRAAGQLGLAEQALGRWEDADRHVREAIQASGDAWVTKNHATLVDALGVIQSHVGRVEVSGDPQGAEVSVNGRVAGRLPLGAPVLVSAGEVDIDLRAPGYVPAQRTVSIVAGQYQRVVLHLAKEADKRSLSAVGDAEGAGGAAPTKAAVPVDQDRLVVPIQAYAAPPPPAASRSAARDVLKWTAARPVVAGLMAARSSPGGTKRTGRTSTIA